MSNTTASDPDRITPLKAPTTISSSSAPGPSPMTVSPSSSTTQPAPKTTPTTTVQASSEQQQQQQPTNGSNNTIPATSPSPAPKSPAPDQPVSNPPSPNQPVLNPPAPNSPAPNAPVPEAPNSPAPAPAPSNNNLPSPPQPTDSSPSTTIPQGAAPVTPTPAATSNKTSVNLVPTLVTVTLKPTSPGDPTVVTVIRTSTQVENSRGTSGSSSSSSSSSSAQLQSETSSSNSGGSGLTGGGKIAVAVVVPILAVAFVVVAALFLWRRRRQRKDAEELRRKEVEEYGYNPNHDPTFPVLENSGGKETFEKRDDDTGYRGWGNTANTSVRKPSTTLSASHSIPGGVGLAFSDSESPTHGTMSDTRSDNALIVDRSKFGNNSESPNGMTPATSPTNINGTINRGISNASTSSSSGDVTSGYLNKQNIIANPFGPETTNGRAEMAAHPIIRDVQARRNTRIESPSHYPQQSSGISQNF
ncbi:hypothetical protein K3495_g8423 [Podosphaera aphanis]|nr:hypothetical protein K3495_g8423 [Podosphaera aphanis]